MATPKATNKDFLRFLARGVADAARGNESVDGAFRRATRETVRTAFMSEDTPKEEESEVIDTEAEVIE